MTLTCAPAGWLETQVSPSLPCSAKRSLGDPVILVSLWLPMAWIWQAEFERESSKVTSLVIGTRAKPQAERRRAGK